MCVGQGGNVLCTCVWVTEVLRCVHVYESERKCVFYLCMCRRVSEVCTCVLVREELKFVNVYGSGRN